MLKPVVVTCVCALSAIAARAATVPGAVSLDNIVTVVGAATATTVIDFSGIAANPSSDQVKTPPAYLVSGYSFADAFHPITNVALGAFGGIVNNGTPMMSLEPQTDDALTMVLSAGGTFALNQVDAAPLWKNNAAATAAGFPNAVELDITGTTSGGTKLSAAFTLAPGAFSTFTLPSAWTGLTSVVFTDNLSAVPEPSSYLLLAAGLALLGAGLRRRAPVHASMKDEQRESWPC